MTLAPSYPTPIPFPVPNPTSMGRPAALGRPAQPVPAALAVETATVEVTELDNLAARLDLLAARDNARVSARGIVAKAFLLASLRHPGVDARWPLLPARHGVRVSELTAALDGADAASPIPEDAAVLSVAGPATEGGERGTRTRILTLSLAFDPRRTDAVAARRLVEELAGLLADPWELIVHC